MSRKYVLWIAFIIFGGAILFFTLPGRKAEEGLEGPSGPKCYFTDRADNGYFVEEAGNRPILAEDWEAIRKQLRDGTSCYLGKPVVWEYDPTTGKPRKIWIEILGKSATELPIRIKLEVE